MEFFFNIIIKVTFLAKKLSPFFYYLILLFQLSVANPENFEEFKAREVLKIRKEKTGISPTSLSSVMAVKTNHAKFALCTKIKLSAYAYSIFKVWSAVPA